MAKTVKVINNKDRYFNWARKWQVIQVDENRVAYYLQHGFSLVKEVQEKKNIVNPQEPVRTKAELYKILDHYWVEYTTKMKVAELEQLVVEAEAEVQTEQDSNEQTDIESIKEQLVDEAIVDQSELKWKTNAEIMQIAKDNWLI